MTLKTISISASRYFLIVGLLSLLWIALYVASKPSWIQITKETLGLSPKLQASNDSFYNSRIDPIFEKYCTACHDHNKNKGQLRLDSYRQLNFSGRSGANLLSSEKNLIIDRMSLPANNRLAMPPYGRERHSQSELALIKLWLSKDRTGSLTEADFPDAPEKANVITFKNIDWEDIKARRAPFKNEVENLKKNYPHALAYIARTSEYLILNTYVIRTEFNDISLLEFVQVANQLKELNLAGTQISDKSIETIQTMLNLETLDIRDTSITKKHLEKLITLPKLKLLFINSNIVSTEISEKFIEKNINLIKVN